jgi:ADP-ribosylglycohydrolase
MHVHYFDPISGCLLGGAIGDALGAPIEFLRISDIRKRYGPSGIRTYVEFPDGKGSFTDDTQMTIFSVEGLLRTRFLLPDSEKEFQTLLWRAYLRWLYTQGVMPAAESSGLENQQLLQSHLLQYRSLFVRRSPGNTCLQSLQSNQFATIETPKNQSKGCGGLMRSAPFGLFFAADPEKAFRISAEASALTHGHASGFLSSGFLASTIAFLVQKTSLKSAISASIDILRLYKNHYEVINSVEKALHFVAKYPATPESLDKLGSGWVAEEALSMSLFCALAFQDDFLAGTLAAVNHSGDSDSTGSITGNILGVIHGRAGLPASLIKNLNDAWILDELAHDFVDCFSHFSPEKQLEWISKYPPV